VEEAIAWVWVVDAMDGGSKDWRGAAEDVAGDIGRGEEERPAEQWRIKWAGPTWIWAFQIMRM